MITVDLKLVLFLIAVVVAGITLVSCALTLLIVRRSRRARLTELDLSVFDHAPFGVILFDGQGRPEYSNDYARSLQLTVKICDGCVGDSSGGADADESQSRITFEQDVRRALSGRSGQSGASAVVHTATLPNGRAVRWWLCGGSNRAVAFILNVSQQRQSEVAVHNFIGTLSHELRTPLTAMLSHLQIARTAELPAATREASLDLVNREIDRIIRLVQDLFLLSRIQASSDYGLRAVDVVLLADEVVGQMFMRAEGKGIALDFASAARVPRVRGDPDQLKQVFLNLVDNAIKYGRRGDSVTIRITTEDEGVMCEVSDTGPGIPAEHLPHLTRRLYRVHNDGEGSGFGLAIVEEILRRHDSRLEIESVAEGDRTGTHMRFKLAKWM